MTSSCCQKTILPNSLRIVTERLPHLHSVSIGIWIEAGSANETPEKNGVSHFVEHIVFKGTPRRTAFDIAHSLESLGGQLNAFTGRDSTCYYARILDEHLSIAIDVLSDILSNSLFDEQDIDRERGVILEEIREVQDTPDEFLSDLFARSIWAPHPVGHSILGTEDHVLSFTPRDLLDHLDAYYNTRSVIIVAAGNVDHAKLVEEIARRFHFSDHEKPALMELTDAGTLRVEHTSKDISQVHLCLGARAYPYRDARRMAILAIHTVLGSGMSSRLFQNIREKLGLAYSVYSYLDMLDITGLFAAYAATDPSNAEQVVGLICRNLHRIMNEPLSSDELDAVKSQFKGSLVLGLESTANRIMRLARQESYLGYAQSIEETIAEIEALEAEEIMRTASMLFSRERLHLTTLGPQSLDQGLVQEIIASEM